MDKQDSEPAGEVRTRANTLPLSPNRSSLGEGHGCFQLAEPVSLLPFRTQHLLNHPRTDRLSGRQFTSGFQHCPFPFPSLALRNP